MPISAPLSPRAYRRVAREAVSQPFAGAASALNEDWGTDYDGKQIQRWARSAGEQLLAQQAAERQAYQRGRRPAGPANDPPLLVIGMDGGRVQSREKPPESPEVSDPGATRVGTDTSGCSTSGGGGRWREDKVLTISSYLPGDGQNEKPQPLVTTYLATMSDSDDFGVLARLEAERRGIRQARHVVVIGDGAATSGGGSTRCINDTSGLICASSTGTTPRSICMTWPAPPIPNTPASKNNWPIN